MVQPDSTEGRSFFNILRDLDRDRYLASLLMPRELRTAIASLYAFNAEIASVRDRVREALPGEVRLQWWREVVSGERQSEAAAHPVAARLMETIAEHGLPRAPLEAMCEARLFDLYDDPMPDRLAYEGYAGETASALLQMTIMLLAPDAAPSSSEAAGHAGIAQGVAGHLMLLPLHAARGQLYLPGDLLAATGLDRERFLAASAQLRDTQIPSKDEDHIAIDAAIEAFVALGREHLTKARAALSDVAAPARLAFCPVSIAPMVFDRAERAGHLCLVAAPVPTQWRRQWRMWRASQSGRL